VKIKAPIKAKPNVNANGENIFPSLSGMKNRDQGSNDDEF
jgi:hypothetical protein